MSIDSYSRDTSDYEIISTAKISHTTRNLYQQVTHKTGIEIARVLKQLKHPQLTTVMQVFHIKIWINNRRCIFHELSNFIDIKGRIYRKMPQT